MVQVISDEINRLSNRIIGHAIHVHNSLGPGLYEKVYEECLCYLFSQDGIVFERQKTLPVRFDDVYLDAGFRIDILVEDQIILELKAVDKMIPVYETQLYTYLKLSGKPLGLLMNFNEKLMKHGIKRIGMTQ